ncbi:ISL3 family transposase [Streptomyces virginiae]|uniref:ISL3 family transposase n=1 Tax=Streptomyces virginiae TaxID=1961 RepID=UPI0037BD4417
MRDAGCGMPSWRVHGRYVRRLGDAPVAGSRIVIELTVRRFKCLSSRCPAVTFAEQIEGLTRPHARQTQVPRSMLASIALGLAGRPGARLAAALGIRIAKDALLGLLHSVPQPPVGAVRFLGVDDFALRKGDSYATILVDLEARRPVDVPPGRDAEPLAARLRRHPEVEVSCRDRAGAYAEGARNGAPQAMQVADAWHLWRNIAEAVERTVGSHHGCIQTAFAEPPVIAEATAKDLVTPEPSRPPAVPFVPPDGTLDVSGQPRRLVARTTERYAAVHALPAEGKSLAAIGRTLRLDHSTVRRFARATSLDELLARATGCCQSWTSTSPTSTPAGWRAVTTFPSSTGNCASADSPGASSASAATSAPSDLPANQTGSSSRCPDRGPGRPRNPDASSAGS